MIAYNKTWLEYDWIHEQMDEAFYETCIERDELTSVKKIYEKGFYTPQFLIAIGLFIVSVIVILFSFGLMATFFPISGTKATFGIECLFFSSAAYGGLEWIVQKRHFRSGVDEALIWASAIFLFAGINFCFEISPTSNAAIIVALSLWYTLRFLESLFTVVGFLAVLGFMILWLEKGGEFFKALIPIATIMVSLIFFFLTAWFRQLEAIKFYRKCFMMVEIAALLCIYLASNFYVVTELGKLYLHLDASYAGRIPADRIYWALTFIIPAAYIIVGIIRKEPILLRVGLACLTLTIFTVRHYFHLLPIETLMIISGTILIIVSYSLLRWLRVPRHGFHLHEGFRQRSRPKRQIESILISQLLGTQKSGSSETKSFGGGTGGGSGAGGNY
jgi:hypothetical protein